MKVLIDNDVLVKGACYGLLQELVASVPDEASRAGVLGASPYIVPKLIKKQKLRKHASKALKIFNAFLTQNDILEPSVEEQRLAANLESSAQTLAVNLDVGESQLVAILIIRSVPFLLSGDKRAILALEQLLDSETALVGLDGKIRCLEQLVRAVLAKSDASMVQHAICDEPEVDKALSICFSCSNPDVGTASIAEGLDSYVAALRSGAGRILSI